MGSGASTAADPGPGTESRTFGIPDREYFNVDECKALAGDLFDEAKFNDAKDVDGRVTREALMKAASEARPSEHKAPSPEKVTHSKASLSHATLDDSEASTSSTLKVSELRVNEHVSTGDAKPNEGSKPAESGSPERKEPSDMKSDMKHPVLGSDIKAFTESFVEGCTMRAIVGATSSKAPNR